jgi:hypothetical protein
VAVVTAATGINDVLLFSSEPDIAEPLAYFAENLRRAGGRLA